VLNLIAGIGAELDLVERWASGGEGEGEQGYLKSDDNQELVSKHPDWFNPSRHIYTFPSPTLNNFTNSPFMSRLLPIVPPLVRLSYSIHRLFDYVTTTYNPFVASDPTSYQEVVRKLSTGVPVKGLTSNEQVYVNFVFGMNRTIHQGLIGGADSTDEFCLYKAFRNARNAVASFRAALHPEPLPRWYCILHAVATYLIAVSVVEVSRWLNLSHLIVRLL
jgi:hypothetical protein